MNTTTIQFFWQDRRIRDGLHTGVSLHSHTMHSEESLGIVPRYLGRLPALGSAIRKAGGRCEQIGHEALDYSRAFWTPPLPPREAYALEQKQIEAELGLPALVSLTDHDDIRAGLQLRVLEEYSSVPVSTEWSVPFGSTFFHIGVHNLPPNQAQFIERELAVFTASPLSRCLHELFDWLHSMSDVLLVLNHPFWDEGEIGTSAHAVALGQFLERHGNRLHALEVNGMRSWKENQRVLQLARASGHPVVSGGDRHGLEPNANLNLTSARTLPEFIHDVRDERRSHVVFMPHYREPLRLRILQTLIDVLRDYPENAEGRKSWADRVFVRKGDEPVPVRTYWTSGAPLIIQGLVRMVRLGELRGVKSALRLALQDRAVWSDPGGAGLNSLRRVAFFPDTFHEVNGVAHTSREFERYVRRQQIPFLCVRTGPAPGIERDRTVTVLELARSPVAFELDAHLEYDLLALRHARRVLKEARGIGIELVHLTGPGDMGLLGLYVAWRLNVPVVMGWHTNLQQYAEKRVERLLGFLGTKWRTPIVHAARSASLAVLSAAYRRSRIVLAPNTELAPFVRELSGRPVYLMRRGVDVELFTPQKRNRQHSRFRIGYVGRLTAEKNVRFLAELGNALRAAGRDFEIYIVGAGSEAEWLKRNVPNALLTGILRGEDLARAYANMDLFAFPSKTDTFGNVVLEAMASGVPCVVTTAGGPKRLVQTGVTGYVAPDDQAFIRLVVCLMTDLDSQAQMREAARHYACSFSWNTVFETVFRNYERCFTNASAKAGAQKKHVYTSV